MGRKSHIGITGNEKAVEGVKGAAERGAVYSTFMISRCIRQWIKKETMARVREGGEVEEESHDVIRG